MLSEETELDMTSDTQSPKIPAHFRPVAVLSPTPDEIAQWVGGKLLDGESAPKQLRGLGTLDSATAEEISFAASEKHLKSAQASPAGLLLVPPKTNLPGRARIEVGNVWKAVAQIMQRLYPAPVAAPGVHPTAVLGRDVKIGDGASIGPYCVLGDGVQIGEGAILGSHCAIDAGCSVGANSHFHAHVTVQGRVKVGTRVILHPGVVLGADGFRYELGSSGMIKIPQIGMVVIEDDVEIGANTAIDRPFLYETRIGCGTKIDNLVQIGHNCNIGRWCVIAGCTGIAGSVTVEDLCVIGGDVAIRDGITIGKGSIIAARTALHKNCAPGSVLAGQPQLPAQEFFRIQAMVHRLPKLNERVAALEKLTGKKKNPETKD